MGKISFKKYTSEKYCKKIFGVRATFLTRRVQYVRFCLGLLGYHIFDLFSMFG